MALNAKSGPFTKASARPVIRPIKATDDPAEVGPVDLILLCVKAYDVEPAATLLRPMIGSQTVVLPVHGIGHIEKLASVLEAEHVLGGVSLLMAHVSEPGVVQHYHSPDMIEFGEIKGGHSSRCEKSEAVLAVDGFEATVCPNIVDRMWWKLAAYSGVGVFCVVRGDKGTIWAVPETKSLYRRAIAEVVNVARVKGIPLADSVPDEHIAMLDTVPPQWRPSMLAALDDGHPLEIESIQDALCAMGREVGLSTPINEYIYACLKPYICGKKATGEQQAA